jgi:hypothetical protein
VKENFPPKHSANEFFVEIPEDCNPMNKIMFAGKISIELNPTPFLSIKPVLDMLDARP